MFSYFFDDAGGLLATSRTANELDDLGYARLTQTASFELVAVGVPSDGSCPACPPGDVFVWADDFSHVACDCCTYHEPLFTPDQATELDEQGVLFEFEERDELPEEVDTFFAYRRSS